MSSILTSAITGINAIKILIDDTVGKINHQNYVNPEKRVFIENTTEVHNLNPGVQVKEIYDDYNDFIAEEMRKTNAQIKNENTKIDQLLLLERLLCEKSNIFSILTKDLYIQIKNDIIKNNQYIIRKDIKQKLNEIIFELKDFDKKLSDLENNIKNEIEGNINKANQLIDQIREVNVDISCFSVFQIPRRVENFIKKRDDLVDELNNLIEVEVVKKDNNYKILLKNGICLINNNKKQNLIPLTSSIDKKYISIGYLDNQEDKVKKIEYLVSNSTLGALLKFRREELEHARNKVGQLTVNLADSINEYHKIGYDVYGRSGCQIFNISQPQVTSNFKTILSPLASAKWMFKSRAKDSNYVVFFENKHWKVIRLLDHKSIPLNMDKQNFNTKILFDGIEFQMLGEAQDNDFYIIKPYSTTLEKLELLVDESTPFALALMNKKNQLNKNNAIIFDEFDKDLLVNNKETLSDSYQNFSTYISHKCNSLEETLPFKARMIDILHDKKISLSNDFDTKYKNLSYEQQCYLANTKVIETAEKIFNEIVEFYS